MHDGIAKAGDAQLAVNGHVITRSEVGGGLRAGRLKNMANTKLTKEVRDMASVRPGRTGLKRDVAAERTRRDILKAATQEFAARGFGGARLDAIADQMQTTKAMVYYYFNRKEGLYQAVVEDVFDAIHTAEA